MALGAVSRAIRRIEFFVESRTRRIGTSEKRGVTTNPIRRTAEPNCLNLQHPKGEEECFGVEKLVLVGLATSDALERLLDVIS